MTSSAGGNNNNINNSGGGGGSGGVSYPPSLSEKEIAIDRRQIMRKIREHQRNRGQVGEEYGVGVLQGGERCAPGGGLAAAGGVGGGGSSRSAASGGGGGGGSSRFGDEKKASSASNLARRNPGTAAGGGQSDDDDEEGEEDPTEGFESLEHAIYSGSSSHLSTGPSSSAAQSLNNNNQRSWRPHPARSQPKQQPSSGRRDSAGSKNSMSSSTQQLPYAPYSATTTTTTTVAHSAKSLRKRNLLHLLYLAICAGIVFSFAFLIESQKMINYARSPLLMNNNGMEQLSSSNLAVQEGQAVQVQQEVDTPLASTAPEIQQQPQQTAAAPLSEEETRIETLKTILSPSVSTLESLTLTHTPQYRALYWLAVQDDRKVPIPATSPTQEAKLIQRYILALFYYALGGEDWIVQFDFLSAKDECRWNKMLEEGGYTGGVGGCDANGMIRTVALWDNNLKGQLPMEIGELTSVKVMSLYSNEIQGSLPANVAKMSSLELLYLHKNDLKGDFGFMCGLQIDNFRADCFGMEKSVQCECCNVCCESNFQQESQCYTQ